MEIGFFTNTLADFDSEEIVYETLNNIKACVSYFKKYGIPTRFVKLDYTYKNSNHTRTTKFDFTNGLTDLSSLYSLYSKYLKSIKNAENVLKSLKDVKEKYNEYNFDNIIRMLVNKYKKGASVISDSDVKYVENYVNRGIEFLKNSIDKEISGIILMCGKVNSRAIKYCDNKYLNRYLFKKYSIPENSTVKDLFDSYYKDFYNSSEIERVKIDNHLICKLFSFSGYVVYMQLI